METAVPQLFASDPVAAELYASLCNHLKDLGSYTVEEKKTSLHIVAGRAAFLGVHRRKAGLRLNIVLARPLEGSRVVKAEKVSATRYHNEIDITQQSEIDDELVSWLREAHQRNA